MINLFTLRDVRSLSTSVLLRAKAEYERAYSALDSQRSTPAVALRMQLEEALGTLEEELQTRGLRVETSTSLPKTG